MGDSLMTIAVVILAAVLLFVFPMITLADRTDDISQIAVQTATVDFVNNVLETGKITAEDYDDYIQTIDATGNTYSLDLELRRLDENPSKKAAQANKIEIGENIYYSIYTTQIEEEIDLEAGDGILYLKQGDRFTAEAVNNNQTISESLKGFFYKVTGNSSNTITARATGLVMVDGQ